MVMTLAERQARTIGRRQASIAWNRQALTALQLGMADGLGKLGDKVLADATAVMVPGHLDASPYGEGLISSGFVRVWAMGTLVRGRSDIMASRNKPKGLNLPIDEVVMIVGFAAPHAHLHEFGTIKMQARPFLSPAVATNAPAAGEYVTYAMEKVAENSSRRAGFAVSPDLMAAIQAEADRAHR